MDAQISNPDFTSKKPKYLNRLDQVTQLSGEEKKALGNVTEKFNFRSNDYYMSLIDWDDPNDPIKRLVIPDVQELNGQGQLDASHESDYTVLKGLEYKYDSTVILLVNETS